MDPFRPWASVTCLSCGHEEVLVDEPPNMLDENAPLPERLTAGSSLGASEPVVGEREEEG